MKYVEGDILKLDSVSKFLGTSIVKVRCCGNGDTMRPPEDPQCSSCARDEQIFVTSITDESLSSIVEISTVTKL